MKKNERFRRGFTLVEMLVVMALVVLLSGLMAKLLIETLGVERFQRQAFDKTLQDNALADQFRADVAQAESTPDQWRDYQAGKDTLILQLPKGEHVVYRWQENSLRRLAFAPKSKTERNVPTGDENTELAFIHDPQNPKLLRLRLFSVREESPRQTLDIAAALGGDLR
jgi:prepilin-type N-terminal cleavage/methylation domain-containing protein